MIKTSGMMILTALCAFSQALAPDPAQAARDAYRSAYRAWREADPSLEHDAATQGSQLSLRAARLAEAQAKYAAARGYFLEGLIAGSGATLLWLEDARAVEPSMAPPKGLDDYLSAGDTAVHHSMDTFAKDNDRGLQPLRQALDRESKALADLTTAVEEERKTALAFRDEADATEQMILQATVEDRILVAGIRQTLDDTSHDADAWAQYYRTLATLAPPAPQGNASTAPAMLQPPSAITPVPLIRYTGAWLYPPVNGEFHGLEPELAELSVSEENGHATGTLVARFKLPAGGQGDRELRFGFSGDFKNTLQQVFNLITTDGTKGTMELTPGSAFNLLAVKIQTEPKPGKVQQADFVLLKK
ncbi:MAG: hypothetical protein ABSB35_15335 [Bryobacteraceae bacterium]|jgi:hypothetical protein